MAVMPMPTARSPILFLLTTPFFLLLLPHPSSASSPASGSLIENVNGDARGAKDHDRRRRTQEDPNVINEAHVVVLTAANFTSFLAVHRHVVVDFYAPWCYWSRKLAPEYAAAASHLADEGLDVALAKVDATQDRELARAHDVQGYPTVHFFVDGVPRRYPYYGEQTK